MIITSIPNVQDLENDADFIRLAVKNGVSDVELLRVLGEVVSGSVREYHFNDSVSVYNISRVPPGYRGVFDVRALVLSGSNAKNIYLGCVLDAESNTLYMYRGLPFWMKK